MFGKGQGMTMGTFDTLLLAFDMDQRVDEAQSLWNMILHTHERSISKRLFSRMISIYAHHNMPANVIEVPLKLVICSHCLLLLLAVVIFTHLCKNGSIWVTFISDRSNQYWVNGLRVAQKSVFVLTNFGII